MTALRHLALFAQSWSWMVASGIADWMLAAVIVAGWPGSVAWARGGLLVGINFSCQALALAMTAIACGSLDDTPRPAAFAGRPA